MRLHRLLLSIALVLSTASVFAQLPKVKIPPKVPPQHIAPVIQRGPDPSVVRFDFSILSRTNQFRGTVQITAVVKNIGGTNYSSNTNQQNINIYEVPLGGAPMLRKTCQFPVIAGKAALAVNAETRCSWTRAWDTAVEFQPDFKAIISYDPDIRLDSNPANDDVNIPNNTLVTHGSAISALFH
jgi:hypothetical protein